VVVKLRMRGCEGREKDSDGRVLHGCCDSYVCILWFFVFDSWKTSFEVFSLLCSRKVIGSRPGWLLFKE
jgi:hypothetical protein